MSGVFVPSLSTQDDLTQNLRDYHRGRNSSYSQLRAYCFQTNAGWPPPQNLTFDPHWMNAQGGAGLFTRDQLRHRGGSGDGAASTVIDFGVPAREQPAQQETADSEGASPSPTYTDSQSRQSQSVSRPSRNDQSFNGSSVYGQPSVGQSNNGRWSNSQSHNGRYTNDQSSNNRSSAIQSYSSNPTPSQSNYDQHSSNRYSNGQSHIGKASDDHSYNKGNASNNQSFSTQPSGQQESISTVGPTQPAVLYEEQPPMHFAQTTQPPPLPPFKQSEGCCSSCNVM